MTKKNSQLMGLENIGFSETLTRLAGVNLDEIKKQRDMTKAKADEVERSFKGAEKSIKRGARRSNGKFSL